MVIKKKYNILFFLLLSTFCYLKSIPLDVHANFMLILWVEEQDGKQVQVCKQSGRQRDNATDQTIDLVTCQIINNIFLQLLAKERVFE